MARVKIKIKNKKMYYVIRRIVPKRNSKKQIVYILILIIFLKKFILKFFNKILGNVLNNIEDEILNV